MPPGSARLGSFDHVPEHDIGKLHHECPQLSVLFAQDLKFAFLRSRIDARERIFFRRPAHIDLPGCSPVIVKGRPDALSDEFRLVHSADDLCHAEAPARTIFRDSVAATTVPSYLARLYFTDAWIQQRKAHKAVVFGSAAPGTS
jgi:hypothetical protein